MYRTSPYDMYQYYSGRTGAKVKNIFMYTGSEKINIMTSDPEDFSFDQSQVSDAFNKFKELVSK